MAGVEGRLYRCLEVTKQRYFCRKHSIHIHRTYSIQGGEGSRTGKGYSHSRQALFPRVPCVLSSVGTEELGEVLVQRKLIWQIGKMQLVRVMVTKGKWREGRQDRNDSRPGLRESHCS